MPWEPPPEHGSNMSGKSSQAASLVKNALAEDGLILVLTGAGISAESGIPTFRGPEGY